jgi:hypothetical protein
MVNAISRAACAVLLLVVNVAKVAGQEKPRPLFRDFAGLCVHTVQFKPELYKPVTRLVRDYHPLKWDVGDDTSFQTTFPFARNRVDWGKLYANWKEAGFETSASIMFDDLEAKEWKDLKVDAHAYGKALASFFGPGNQGLMTAVEIGNEPGKYDDDTYRALFESMARGLREGDPKLRVAPCAMNLGKSGRYSKSVDTLKGLDDLWDILNIHIYPEVEGWPTWRRSYPEDPKIEFLRDLGHVLEWRKQNAPGKDVWLTEWGYDSSTKPAPKEGTFAKWVGQNDEQQAMWIVRGHLVLAATELNRAYLFFFNDDDTPHVHGSSGLTRNFEPKPSFHAMAHLQKTIGDYRLARVHQQHHEDGYIQEWVHGEDSTKRVTVCWFPTGEDQAITLPIVHDRAIAAERMPLTGSTGEGVEMMRGENGAVRVVAGQRPVFVSWTAPDL